MKAIILTCNATSHIIPIQRMLWSKYVDYPFEIDYLNLSDKPVSDWGSNVSKMLRSYTDERVMFGLDDYLPIAPFNSNLFEELLNFEFDRLELSITSSREKGLGNSCTMCREYLPGESYRASCQFSVWNTEVLKWALLRNGSPWDFECNERLPGKKVLCNREAVFPYVEESALSGRLPGRVNVMGLSQADVCEIIEQGLVDPEEIVYSWMGARSLSELHEVMDNERRICFEKYSPYW